MRRGDLLVQVTLKIGVMQVLTLLVRGQGAQGLKVDTELVGVAPTTDLSALLAVLFSQEAATAMAAGPLRGYRSENQTLQVVRGRVRLWSCPRRSPDTGASSTTGHRPRVPRPAPSHRHSRHRP